MASFETDSDLQIATQLQQKFRGSARVYFQDLSFDKYRDRDIENTNVARLCDIFSTEGCKRALPSNRIPVLISHSHLERSLDQARTHHAALRHPEEFQLPFLSFPDRIEALHGQHRIAAGYRFLAPQNRWWIIDIYQDGKVSVVFRNHYGKVNDRKISPMTSSLSLLMILQTTKITATARSIGRSEWL